MLTGLVPRAQLVEDLPHLLAYLLIRGAATKPGQQPAQVVERLHVVSGQEVVTVRQRRRHASRQRLVALAADVTGACQSLVIGAGT